MANAKFTTPVPVNEPVKSYAPGSIEKKQIKDELRLQRENQREIRVTIGCEKVVSKDFVDVRSPHNKNLILAKCQKATAEDIDRAIQTALKARKDWAALPWEERASVFLKAGELIATKYRAEINAATMLGQSKTVHQAEIDSACEAIDFLRFNPKFMERIYEEQPISSPGIWNRLTARGLEGFVFAVTPFNFTAIAVNLPTAPAMMGCSVLWKPAATAVHSSAVAMKILEEAGLPPGVINFIPGDSGMISKKLLAHPELAGIHFTGSTSVFNYMWKTVGENIANYKNYPRIVGETGGKDFVFMHASADPDEVVTALVRGSFEYQGQKCSAASRAFIPKSLWPGVKERLVGETNALKVGDVEDFTNYMGAVINKSAYEDITGYINYAKNSSQAKIIAGGEYDDKVGYFIRPTIIEAFDPKFKTMVEEIFGPVLTVFVYDDHKLDEAIKLCDESSPYGLTGAIFARDRHVIHSLTQKLEHAAGNFYINDKPTGAVVGQQPFGGARASGTNDKAGSMFNLLRWTNFRTIKENFVPVTDYKYPFMQES
ncbi:MAG: L-glutamate gamma-semialdehyde dehydrogenase [Deltaproteobacteria bacterium]|nr:L-glutamate gamma-semialdehyde dehydrogenase [Deltaproteobacteria bacterium]